MRKKLIGALVVGGSLVAASVALALAVVVTMDITVNKKPGKATALGVKIVSKDAAGGPVPPIMERLQMAELRRPVQRGQVPDLQASPEELTLDVTACPEGGQGLGSGLRIPRRNLLSQELHRLWNRRRLPVQPDLLQIPGPCKREAGDLQRFEAGRQAPDPRVRVPRHRTVVRVTGHGHEEEARESSTTCSTSRSRQSRPSLTWLTGLSARSTRKPRSRRSRRGRGRST